MSRIHSDTSDADLIFSLRQGNQNALSLLYDRYSGLVYTLALKLLDRVDEAEDLTQDVFLSFWKQEKFDPTRAKLSSYLCLITRSRASDKLRSRASEQECPNGVGNHDQRRALSRAARGVMIVSASAGRKRLGRADMK